MTYFISQGWARPPIEVEIEGIPPCLYCGSPVVHESTDGPLVCGACACGRNADGSRWTAAQAKERHEHRRTKVAEYRAIDATRVLAKARDLAANSNGDPVVRDFFAKLIGLCDLRGEELAHYANECGLAKGERSALRDQIKWLRSEITAACDQLPPGPIVTALRTIATIDGAVDVECPTCGALAGWACEGEDYGYHAAGYHAARHTAAQNPIFEGTRL